MSIEELNDRAAFFAKLIWDKTLDIKVILRNDMYNNGELSLMACEEDHTYIAEESYIFINEKILNSGKLVVNDILIHELCHWSLYLDFRDNNDGCDEFEFELKRIGINPSNTCRLIMDRMYYKYNDNGNIIETLYRPTLQMFDYEHRYNKYKAI